MTMIALRKIPLLNFLFKRTFSDRFLYTDQSEVIEELDHRQTLPIDDDKLLELIKPTASIEPLLKKRHLVFFRQVATPLHETLRVIQIANQLGLKLCILEYGDDKLVSAHNIYKLGLGKLPVYKFIDKTGRDIYQNHTIIDFNKYAGTKLKDVYTTKGERLMDFHHELFNHVTGLDIKKNIIDASDWFSQFNNHASEYYEAFFTLFIKHNVLAEIFVLERDKDEEDFANKIANPAFSSMIERFGLGPIIINYQPWDEQTRMYWDCYPAEVNEFLRKKGYIE